jgi:hypothetical protein
LTRRRVIRHEFVEFIPELLDEGTLYVSIPYATAAHLCCCGCAMKVVTPISPTDWRVTYDGESVSLDPSVGNWAFRCQSHYWIDQNRVVWARRWSQRKIDASRAADRLAKENYFAALEDNAQGEDDAHPSE